MFKLYISLYVRLTCTQKAEHSQEKAQLITGPFQLFQSIPEFIFCTLIDLKLLLTYLGVKRRILLAGLLQSNFLSQSSFQSCNML
jgi:hypothetical protein